MKLQIPIILMLALLATSCSTQKSTTPKSMSIFDSGIIQHPIIAELDVSSNKVIGTASAPSGTLAETLKQSAIADALKKSNADLLVELSFETTTAKGIIQLTVSGFPATYKNFRPVTLNDLPLLELGISQKESRIELISADNKKRNPKSGTFWGAFTGAMIGIIIFAIIFQN